MIQVRLKNRLYCIHIAILYIHVHVAIVNSALRRITYQNLDILTSEICAKWSVRSGYMCMFWLDVCECVHACVVLCLDVLRCIHIYNYACIHVHGVYTDMPYVIFCTW